MSMSHTVDRPTPHAEAYPPSQRRADAESHILTMHALKELHLTSCFHICRSYGVPEFLDDLKALRTRFRNELSFGDGK